MILAQNFLILSISIYFSFLEWLICLLLILPQNLKVKYRDSWPDCSPLHTFSLSLQQTLFLTFI